MQANYTVVVMDRTETPYFWTVPALSIEDARVTAESSDSEIEVVCISKQRITNQTRREVLAYAG